MKTSIIGYPRIGSLRELKFASEKYFRGEISASELQETAKQLRLANLNTQRESGLDFIPSGDFSFYDGMLDTAVLLNIVPERYRNLDLSELDTYFAMARGYQGEKGDVKAFAMKKWFNTNYHYMVPEIDDTTEIKLSGNKPFELFAEAFKNDVKTKPVIIGAYTFLKLSKYTGNKTDFDFADAIAGAYSDILKQFADAGADWVQFDEPCLVIDMTAEDKVLFTQLYQKILSDKKGIKVLLQTYFGDVRDCYSEICGLNFDGVGLDFVEGKKNLELIQTNDFPTDKVLFAGVINGKNIWKNNYTNTLCIISELQKHCSEIILNTSCSLLHVPYTLKNETKLSEHYKKHFAYAEEKLTELAELKSILSADSPIETEAYKGNTHLFTEPRSGVDYDVQKKVKSLSNADFV
ncbi:MAG: 5-methyltetrahydropteroyltriglutamate--homocysteine S-methyltransferase, partial [Ruminococcus flavefaciens]|nr:5-methyltetrahydropteroyltriglutamate--homocysteine S-methyltransferase [Ruminococcus flavefaciens]